MCGIAGYLGSFSPDILAHMNTLQAHRGPDGQGMWHEEGVGLAHRRLSIIDLSNAAAQPMKSCADRYVVTFNGEIYNFKKLLNELKSEYEFNPHSDTSILAPLYDKYGKDMLTRLSGIFAFALWDRKTKTLFAARDHAGIKPFYYTQTAKGLAFASELKALYQLEGVDCTLNSLALRSHLTYLWSPGEDTMFNGIKKLLPGHCITAQNNKISVEQWFHEEALQQYALAPHELTAQALQQQLDDAVQRQLMSDVPVGAFLSGGVDSSAVVASMAKQTKQPFNTYCISFRGAGMAEEGFSEDILYARQVAERYNLNLHELEMSADSTLSELADMAYLLDEPQADPAPVFVRKISAFAREQGDKVLLSGTGGDDIFSGYRRHLALHRFRHWWHVPQPVRAAVLGTLQVSSKLIGRQRRLDKLCSILQQPSAMQALLSSYQYTQPNTVRQLLKIAPPATQQDYLQHQIASLPKNISLLQATLMSEQYGFLPDHNLNYTDKMGMAEGIEIRVPFLDPHLMAYASRLSNSQRIKGREMKWLLKKSQESRLPHDVLYRSKAGFGAPVRLWLKQKNNLLLSTLHDDTDGLFQQQEVNNLLKRAQAGQEDDAYTLLAIAVVRLWHRRFVQHTQSRAQAA